MADPYDLDDGFPVLDPCQDAVDTNAPTPTGIGALKLFSIRCAPRVLASVKVLLNPGQDYVYAKTVFSAIDKRLLDLYFANDAHSAIARPIARPTAAVFA